MNSNEMDYNNSQINTDSHLEKNNLIIDNSTKKDICSSPYLRNNLEEYTTEEIQIKIDILNDINDNSHSKISTSNNGNEFEIINQDCYLKPYESQIQFRVETFRKVLSDIYKNEGSLLEFSLSYMKMGLNLTKDGILYREYAPGASSLTIVL